MTRRRTVLTVVAVAALAILATPAGPAAARGVADGRVDGKLDLALRQRTHGVPGTSRVILRARTAADARNIIRDAGATPGRVLSPGDAVALEVPNASLRRLARHPDVLTISLDRMVTRASGTLAAAGTGAQWVSDTLGFDGSGVGVATIDSGISAAHDDLDPARVVHWADFVNRLSTPYDDYGHGTHVAGIIAGTGRDSAGAHRGLAPGANLVVLKALDGTGSGRISDVIAAVDYAIANRDAYNIRVLNLSVAAGVYESCYTDPLTLAALRAVNAGITVVAAAGNFGLSPQGEPQQGGITAPGNAPWVLTVGATNQMGTADRSDDVVAAFSSRGPSAIDGTSKPDVVAPGVAIESTADAGSALFALNPRGRVWGSVQTVSQPYLSLTGTSMAAPIVTGTVALMLQANPALTPNAVKAILQFTAEQRPGVDALAEGAGMLNARGAVALARQFATRSDDAGALETAAGNTKSWSHQVIWGDRTLTGDTLAADANAWQLGVLWGASRTPDGEPVSPLGVAETRREEGAVADR